MVVVVFCHKYGQFSPSSRLRNFPAMFFIFKICSHIFLTFEVKLE